MKQLHSWLRDYFAFSNTEMRGVLVLTIGGFLLLLAPFMYRSWLSEGYVHLEKDQKILDSLILLVENRADNQILTTQINKQLFAFNPNTEDQQTLQLLGIPAPVAESIIHYREKGGVFKKKGDLLKIYHFPKPVYEEIKEYIALPAKTRVKKNFTPEVVFRPFDINLADTSQLAQLRGIGSVLSERIVKFRDALGGFYSPSQWAEVYHINDKALEQLKKYTFIAKGFVPKKLNINVVDWRALNSHPYISYDLAKAIISHRKTYGEFSAVHDLKEVYLMDDTLFEKLLPYISI